MTHDDAIRIATALVADRSRWEDETYYTTMDGEEYPNAVVNEGKLAALIADAILAAVAAERERIVEHLRAEMPGLPGLDYHIAFVRGEKTVRTRFIHIGQLEPLPLPDD